MHIVVIGGASTYTPELIDGLIHRAADLGLTEVTLVDPDEQRRAVVAAFCRRMVVHLRGQFVITDTADRRNALQRNPAYVITQLRVGGQAARHGDELLGRRHGLIGQETTGVGGFAKALRTIPIMLDIAADMRRYCPAAWLINFTNPAGIVTEALVRHGGVPVIGLCNNAMTAQRGIARSLAVPPEAVRIEQVGLNHLNWIRRIEVDGSDVTAQVLDLRMGELRDAARSGTGIHVPAELIGMLQALPSGYLDYFYLTNEIIAKQRDTPTRAEVVMDVERRLIERYADVHLCEKPAELMERGGAYYSTAAAALICSHHLSDGAVHVVNVQNGTALPDLPSDVVVEVPCRVDRNGAHPLAHAPLAPVMHGLTSHVKAYEQLTIDAVVRADEQTAIAALLSNPLGPDALHVEAVWHDLRQTNARWMDAIFAPRA